MALQLPPILSSAPPHNPATGQLPSPPECSKGIQSLRAKPTSPEGPLPPLPKKGLSNLQPSHAQHSPITLTFLC
jgi:hypothetical protein